MQVFDGRIAAKAINERTQHRVSELKERGITPSLAIVRVGEDPSAVAYEKGIVKRCTTAGVIALPVTLPENITQTELEERLRVLNEDSAVHGIMLFRPLPKHLVDSAACAAIAPEKDVDGLCDGSLATVFRGSGKGFAPCTAQACVELVKFYGVELTGRRVVVVGRSLVVGKPLSMLLLAENATVTLCHSKTRNLPELCREADVLIAAIGKARFIGDDFVRPGQYVIDVGVNFDDNGKQCGDVDYDAVCERCTGISPVPFGVGSVTSSILTAHVVEAAARQNP